MLSFVFHILRYLIKYLLNNNERELNSRKYLFFFYFIFFCNGNAIFLAYKLARTFVSFELKKTLKLSNTITNSIYSLHDSRLRRGCGFSANLLLSFNLETR